MLKCAIKAIYNPDIIEAAYMDNANYTNKQSFIYVK